MQRAIDHEAARRQLPSYRGDPERPYSPEQNSHSTGLRRGLRSQGGDPAGGRRGVCATWKASRIYNLLYLHGAGPTSLLVKLFLQYTERGVLATRALCRPKAIGLSVVKLIRREGTVLYLSNVDILDGTPLLDIKPYTSRFDRIEATSDVWQDQVDEGTARRRGERR